MWLPNICELQYSFYYTYHSPSIYLSSSHGETCGELLLYILNACKQQLFLPPALCEWHEKGHHSSLSRYDDHHLISSSHLVSFSTNSSGRKFCAFLSVACISSPWLLFLKIFSYKQLYSLSVPSLSSTCVWRRRRKGEEKGRVVKRKGRKEERHFREGIYTHAFA